MLDAIAQEVLRHRLDGIAEEMNVALIRSAFSTNITDRKDCSCALFLPHGETVAQSASGTPLHLGVMPAVLGSVLRRFPLEEMQSGDQYIMNTPYPAGPGHLNDITLVSPVIRDAAVVALVANQAHHVDVGGMVPGSMPSDAREIFQEGLQIPPVALVRAHQVVDDVLELILTNLRTPQVSRGDLLAQVAANHTGVSNLERLLEELSVAQLKAGMEQLIAHSEAAIRRGLSALREGRFVAEDVIEGPDGPLTIRVVLTIEGGELWADFSGTSPQVDAPLNCRPPTLSACVAYVVQALIDPSASPNAGSLRPLHIAAPEGSLLNARYPASVVQSNIITTQRICDVLIRALQPCLPDRISAASSGNQGLLCIGGLDPRRDEPFTYIETHGGGAGGSPQADGQSAVHTHMTNTLNSPVEVLEQDFPLEILEYGLAVGSAGAGRHRGGLGIKKVVRLLCDATVTTAFDRVESRPWGLEGGQEAAPARIELQRDGQVSALSPRASSRMRAGDILTIVTPGGGGFGPVELRDPEAVLADTKAGLIELASPPRHRREPSSGLRLSDGALDRAVPSREGWGEDA